MHFSKLILLVSPILAFTVPEGQPSGVYQVSYENGEEKHTLIKSIDDNTPSPSGPIHQIRSAKHLDKRASYACGGDALNHANTDRANSELDGQCGNFNYVGGNLDFYSIVGCTVAYYCNFSPFALPCSATSRQQASAGITGYCGWYKSGWTTYANAPWSYGYEDFCKWPGSHFCGRGTGG